MFFFQLDELLVLTKLGNDLAHMLLHSGQNGENVNNLYSCRTVRECVETLLTEAWETDRILNSPLFVTIYS